LPRRFLSHWRGVLLSLVGIVAILWLAATDQLGLYIHPRYFVFTVIMSVLAMVLIILAFSYLPSHVNETSEPDSHSITPRSAGVWVFANVLLLAGTATALLVLPPTMLTAATVAQRDINGSASSPADSDAVILVGADDSALSVKDWAGILRQGADEISLAGKTPTLIGFVTPDPDDPTNVFYVARFVITCCAVDAQPIGVPIYLPGWQDQFEVEDWVSVTGAFISNPSIEGFNSVVLSPSDISVTDQPAQPYVY
jgi:uncharacterized repeat protein (TIGR03943 family)